VRAAIVKSLQNLTLFPQAGRKQEIEGVRKIVTRRYPYLEVAGEIVILAIRHSARAREHANA
jgi:toxin ParE1/3/4